MASLLILYSTTDGHTLEICQRLQHVVEKHAEEPEHDVTLFNLNDVANTRLESFDKIVLGASIRYGRHQPQVYQFIKSNRLLLEKIPCAFFTVNVVARKPEKSQPDTNPYLLKFLKQTAWKPEKLAVFAGQIDYQRYSFWDKHIIRFIMWVTHGPTNLNTKIDYTNWDDVDKFASEIINM